MEAAGLTGPRLLLALGGREVLQQGMLPLRATLVLSKEQTPCQPNLYLASPAAR